MAKRVREIGTYTGPLEGENYDDPEAREADGIANHEAEQVPWQEVAEAAVNPRPDAIRKTRRKRIGMGSSLEDIDAALQERRAALAAVELEVKQLEALQSVHLSK